MRVDFLSAQYGGIVKDDIYSERDVAAFQRVGEFLSWFSLLESDINESIINLLALDAIVGRLLLSYVPFARKCEFLRELFGLKAVGFKQPEKKNANSKLGRIQELSAIRNVVAHSAFSAHRYGVKFFNADKRLRPDTSRIINKKTFRKYRADMADLRGWLAQITHRVKAKTNEHQIAEAISETALRALQEALTSPKDGYSGL